MVNKTVCHEQEDAETATCSGSPVTRTDDKHVVNIHAMLKENHSTMYIIYLPECKATAIKTTPRKMKVC
jgi:hypothetical protein